MLKRLCLALFVLLPVLAHAQAPLEPLEPERAFRFSAQAVDANTVELRWEIAPDYYMYRDKFSFAVEPGSLGKVELPSGIVKEDENFGRVETYRDSVRVRLPVSDVTGRITVRATGQGCADMGICYPPQKYVATVDLPSAAMSGAAPASASASGWQARLLRPSLYGPAILGLIGVVLAAVPLRVRRGLWFKGMGFTLMFVGAILLLMLNREESAPEAAHEAPIAEKTAAGFTLVHNVIELDALLALAKDDKKTVLLDFYADWCGPCREMEKLTFSDATVAKKMAEFLLLRVDVTANTKADQELLQRFKLQGPPGIILFEAAKQKPEREPRETKRIIGFREPEAFLSELNR